MGEEKRVEKKEERVNSFPVPSTVVCTLPRFLNGQLIRRGGMDREGELKSFNCDNFKDEVDFNCDNGVEKERDEISLEVKGKVQQVAFLLKTLFFSSLRASMKDEWNKIVLSSVLFAFLAQKFSSSSFFFFYEYKLRFLPRGRVGGKSGRGRRLKQFSAASRTVGRRTWRLVEKQAQVEIGS